MSQWKLQVLESIKSQSISDPKPFPISKQYKVRSNNNNNNKKEGETEAGEDDESEQVVAEVSEKSEVHEVAKGKGTGKTSAQKSKNNKKKVKAKVHVPSSGTPCVNTYVPAEYAQKRKAFIDGLRKDGHSYNLANMAWNLSKEKRSLLCGLSVSELKRRRFLGKGEQENPWAK